MAHQCDRGSPRCMLMDSKIWDSNTDYFLSVPPYISKDVQVADDACIQFQIDFVGRNNLGAIKASLSPYGSFSSMAFCDLPSDKLAIVAYVMEVALFYDDCDLPAADEFSKTYKEIQGRKVLLENKATWKSKFKLVFSMLAKRMIDADPVLGSKVIDELNDWKSYESVVRERFNSYTTLDQYVKDRVPELGWDVMIACACFGTGITISVEDRLLAEKIYEPLLEHSAYGNDYFSWDKEIEEHRRTGEPLINAIVLLQRWHHLSVDEAKASLKQMALEVDKEYQRRKTTFFDMDIARSPSLKWWFSMIESIAAAGQVWHMSSFRHHDPHGSGYIDYFDKRTREGIVWRGS